MVTVFEGEERFKLTIRYWDEEPFPHVGKGCIELPVASVPALHCFGIVLFRGWNSETLFHELEHYDVESVLIRLLGVKGVVENEIPDVILSSCGSLVRWLYRARPNPHTILHLPSLYEFIS